MYIFYVYSYLSETTLLPYYIGKGKGFRCISKHKHIAVPKDKSRIKIVAHKLSEVEAWILERKLISYYGRRDLNTGILLNRTDGGEGPSGRIPWNKNKTHSEETRQKISKSSKGRMLGVKQSEEHIRKRMASKAGYVPSEDTKRKISLAKSKPNPVLSNTIRNNGGHSGENNGMYGKHHTEETKQLFRDKFSKPFTVDGITYQNIKECSEDLNIPPGTIASRLRRGVYTRNI